MFDMRRVLLEPRFLELAVNLFWDEFSDEYPFQVGGLETASIPLISGIQIESMRRAKPVNGFIVRKERKLSGTGTLIEGSLSEDKIIVVDDILNSADSISRVGAVLDACSRNIYSVFVLLDYRAQPGLEWRSRNTITVRSLFSLSDFDVELRERKQEAVKREIFRLKWTFRAPLGSFHYRIPKSSPIVDGMTIYFGTDDGTFWALDALSGERRWCFEVRTSGRKNLWSSPSLFEQSVLFGAYDGNVYRLDKSTGEVQWSFSEADWVGSSPAIAGDLGLVFIGLEFATPGKQGAIAALDIGTGEKVWERQTVRYTHASPIYDARNGIVVCGSNNDEIFALEAKTGFDRWRFQTRGDGRKGSVRHAGAIDYTRDQLLVGAADGYIYVIDLLSGCEIWHIRTDNEVYTIPLVHEDYAFVGSTDKYLYVIDLEKKRVHKKHSLQSKIYAPPRLLNGSVYSAACDGRIVKLSPSSGDILGIHQLPDAVTNALAYCNETGLYYALTYVGELYALSES
jgi:outer membrane protein assembly factor BamB/orotate phosphoribosyltransferase